MTRRALLLASAAVPLAAIHAEPYDGWYGATGGFSGVTVTVPATPDWNDFIIARGRWMRWRRDGL